MFSWHLDDVRLAAGWLPPGEARGGGAAIFLFLGDLQGRLGMAGITIFMYYSWSVFQLHY